MSRKSKKRKQKPKDTPRSLQEAAESRSATAATVGWSLALMSTVMAELIGFSCQLYVKFVESLDVLVVLGAVMLFVALVAGVVTLVMTPVVLKLAKQRPPSSLVQTAWLAGSLPLVVVVIQFLTSV